MKQSFAIGDRRVGVGEPALICAEMGVTCNYDMSLSKELIDVTAEAGADAAKFIFWFPDEMMSDRTISYTYQTTTGTVTENMYEMVQQLRFTLDEWRELKAYADERGVLIFSTVCTPSGVTWAEALGLEAYKISSWDYHYPGLWKAIASKGKPVLVDTGPVTLAELAQHVDLLSAHGCDEVCLIHNVHSDDPVEINMRSVAFMERTFGCPAGYSASGREMNTDVMALTLGARYLEKRLTMSRDLPGHHHVLCLEPGEFKAYVALVREVEASLGIDGLRPSSGDIKDSKRWFKRIVANMDLPAGTVLTEQHLAAKRPADGVRPTHIEQFLGRPLKRALKENEPIGWADV
ncbi:MAG: N-acetylneuraminate synthase family protein [Planctomycetota bacterium]